MTRILAMLAVLFVAMTSPAVSATVQKCPAPKNSPSVDHTDKRVREILARVIDASLLKDNFALCQYAYHVPTIARIPLSKSRTIVVVSLPKYVSMFSDDELEGLFGHELGHVSTWDHTIASLSDEKGADAKGRDWVGVRKMLAFMDAMKRSLNHFPRFTRKASNRELNERARALIDPIFVMASRT